MIEIWYIRVFKIIQNIAPNEWCIHSVTSIDGNNF